MLQVIELFKAADKYDVRGLVQECVSHFRQLTGANEIAPLLQVTSLVFSYSYTRMPKHFLRHLWCKFSSGAGALTLDACKKVSWCPGKDRHVRTVQYTESTLHSMLRSVGDEQGPNGERLLVQVAAARHSVALRSVCIDIATHCLPDVLVSSPSLRTHQPALHLPSRQVLDKATGCGRLIAW